MQQAIAAVKVSGAESCAVCLLFSFLDDSHERKVGEALARGHNGLMIFAFVRGAAGIPRIRAVSPPRCSMPTCSR